ncbi:MAG: hypothetical protein ACR2MK_12190 [Solirubrobacteraceae bacterium]
MSKAINKFKELPPAGQAAIVTITAWNLWLSGSAQRDIQRRPRDQIRGRKVFWRLACLTNTIGPVVYFRWGRR